MLARLPAPGPPRARRRRHPAAGRQGRTTPRGVGQGPPGRARQVARPGLWAGRTPTPTPSPSASGPCSRSAASCRSPSSGRRSSSRRWPSPHPGWIRGFRMADPVIISYAKGLLKEFPGVPGGHHRRHPGRPGGGGHPGRGGSRPAGRSPTCSTPRRAPATRSATGSWSTWSRPGSSSIPLADSQDQPITVPEWSFPGRNRVQRQLRQATQALGTAEKALQSLPLRGRQAELSARLEERRDEAERALSYVELYGAYTETEAVFSVDRLLDLFSNLSCRRPAGLLLRSGRHRLGPLLPRRLPPVGRRPRPGAPGAGSRVRVGAARAPTGMTREERGRRAVLAPERQLAVFDLENTLIASNVVDSYAWLATRHSGRRRPGPLRAAHPAARRPGCWPSTAPTGATSCATSTAATRGRPVERLQQRQLGAVQRPGAHQVVPGRDPPGPRAPGPRATRPCSSPAPWTW